MGNAFVGLISIIIVMVLILTGVPVGFALAAVGIIVFLVLTDMSVALSMTGMLAYSTVASYTFVIIPLFILMGNLLVYTNIVKDAFKVMQHWVGHLPGGLGQATTLASAMYGAVTGNSVAATANLSQVAIPEMRKYNYADGFSCAVLVSAGTFAMMIPPSLSLVFLAMAAQQSVGAMLLAGYIPGLMTAVAYMITIYLIAKFKPALAPTIAKTPLKDRLTALKDLWAILLLMLIILLLLYSGIITPTEVGAIGSLAVILIGLILKRLSWKNIWVSFVDTTKSSGALFAVMVGAFIYAAAFTYSGVPAVMLDWVAALVIHPYAIIAVMMLMLLILGTFMSPIAIIFLMAPLMVPIAVEVGMNAIVFCILFVKTIEIGAVTPPYGINLFALSAVMPDIKMGPVLRGVVPFILADLVTMVLFVIFPIIVLFLPSIAR